MKILGYSLILIVLLGCGNHQEMAVDLNGTWQFSIDTNDTGITSKWFSMDLTDSVELPGTMDINRKGFRNTDTTTMHLNRLYKYEGVAWYRRKIMIPENFADKHVQLNLERTKFSRVWIDTVFVGESHLLQSAQHFDVTGLLTPGEHYITVRIDNRLSNTPFGNVHIYSDDTQTNWNGIIGKMTAEASEKTYISDLQVYPDPVNGKCRVKLKLVNRLNWQHAELRIKVDLVDQGKIKHLKTLKTDIICDSLIEIEYAPGKNCRLWDEYRRPLYQLTAEIRHDGRSDLKTVSFGMRKFGADGTQFAINGRKVFLRGKHDACVFPLTGHPPMDTEGWVKVFRIAKTYGINHYRFHSWCPPEAAFEAADLEGIYIQAELPFWGGLESDTTASMLQAEGFAMLKAYANHPSFVLFSHGNEIWSGHDRVEKNIKAFRLYDARPLYTMGSNNNIGYMPPREVSDFFVAARTPYAHDTVITHTRLTHAFADSKEGGILNTRIPSAKINYAYAVSQIHIPIISHEIGQYQIYPDYTEIEKYTGVLKPWNLEVFKMRLKKSGMLDQNVDFTKASGAWSALCYKAEIEAALRTPGLAGFQLLDLQDFPGQGTALVGILDAFMDDKGVISKESWLQSCNDVVILAEFPKYCWLTSEHFRSDIEVANYSDLDINTAIDWELRDKNGTVIKKGMLDAGGFKRGTLSGVGSIDISLAGIAAPEKMTLFLSMRNTRYTNAYPLWIYGDTDQPVDKGNIIVARKLEADVIKKLEKGSRVLLFPEPENVKDKSVGGLFPPEFWNYGMFKGISEWAKKPVSPGTLGILTDPSHPLFNLFPTDFHTNWQWFSIIKSSAPLILDKTPANYRPVVQVIDNLERNHKLGLIFECKVGEGYLLVCMAALPELSSVPEAAQLYKAITAYMNSDAFHPEFSIDKNILLELLT